MRTIYFYGDLAERYGPQIQLNINSIAELVRAMDANYGDFTKNIIPNSYHIFRGSVMNEDNRLTESELVMNLGRSDIHILPAVVGSGPIIAPIVGVVIAAVGTYGVVGGGIMATFWGMSCMGMILTGTLMMLGGLLQLLTPMAETDTSSTTESDSNSFLFNGPANSYVQGGCVPVVYGGPILVGSTLISSGIEATQLIDGGSDDEGGGGNVDGDVSDAEESPYLLTITSDYIYQGMYNSYYVRSEEHAQGLPDDLAAIYGSTGASGIMYVTPYLATDQITIKSGTGNIWCFNNQDHIINSPTKAGFYWDGTWWLQFYEFPLIVSPPMAVISSGTITAAEYEAYLLYPESWTMGATTDDLTYIYGTVGTYSSVVLVNYVYGNTITIKHGVGNIWMLDSSDCVLGYWQSITFTWNGTWWVEVFRA